MDLLILLVIISALINSINQSNAAKKKYAQKQQQSAKQLQPKKNATLIDLLNDLEETAGEVFAELEQPRKKQVPTKKASSTAVTKEEKEKQQTKSKHVKTAKQLSTLFEQAEGKQNRSGEKTKGKQREHSGDMQPVKPSVQPLKNVYQNTEKCEHRIELNPNIQYQGQKLQAQKQENQKQEAYAEQKQIRVQCDQPEDIIQGVIWAEILGKPKAMQNMRRR